MAEDIFGGAAQEAVSYAAGPPVSRQPPKILHDVNMTQAPKMNDYRSLLNSYLNVQGGQQQGGHHRQCRPDFLRDCMPPVSSSARSESQKPSSVLLEEACNLLVGAQDFAMDEDFPDHMSDMFGEEEEEFPNSFQDSFAVA
jgi:hypothetical protein